MVAVWLQSTGSSPLQYIGFSSWFKGEEIEEHGAGSQSYLRLEATSFLSPLSS